MRAILTFHSIDDSGSVLSYDARLFEALLTELTRKGVPVYDLDTLLADDKKCGIAITFDDGMKSVYKSALPILREHQAPSHMFLTTDDIGASSVRPQQGGIPSFDMLDWDEVEALQLAGMHMECHTHTHPDMRTLSGQQIADECGEADRIIQSRLGRNPKYFAYPFGYHNRLVSDFVRDRYSASCTTELRKLGGQEDRALLPRLDSYYLRSPFYIRLIDSTVMHWYLALRNQLRNLRGQNFDHV